MVPVAGVKPERSGQVSAVCGVERQNAWLKGDEGSCSQNSINIASFPSFPDNSSCSPGLLVYMAYIIKRKTNEKFGELASWS